MSINKEKIDSIQQLRGISALMVVLCHLSQELKNYPILKKIFHRGENGVHIFFFISGYIIIYSLIKNNYHIRHFFSFLLKRSLRIDPPYLVSIILLLFSYAFFSNDLTINNNPFTINIKQLLSHIFYYVPFTKFDFYSHVYWTLCIEFQFYILIGLIYFLFTSRLYRFIFLLILTISSYIPQLNSYYLITNYGAIFASGMALMHYKKDKHLLFLFNVLICAVAIYFRFGITVATMLMIAGAMIYINWKFFKPLNFLGEISYSLYITHTIVLYYFNGWRYWLDSSTFFDLFLLPLGVLVSILFAYIFYIIIEKPSIHISKKINLQSN